MATVIASTYEIIREIGAGGSGVVYLGRHIRLNKSVVLKADKRRMSGKIQELRREVDTLRNLRHPYIPQVYDFLEENGIVYTVMDYIEGESLDKPLKRGERFGQAQIIKWTKQLLEALRYLHSRPPYGFIHGDIKPSNIMITPEGDICLIDFNIALALGEEGAVRVGFTKGYAAPEWSADEYDESSFEMTTLASEKSSKSLFAGRVRSNVSGHRFISVEDSGNHLNNNEPEKNRISVLDARSDIYSVGATLYHLLTGTRPAANVEMIAPVSSYSNRNISPLLSKIVEKAMNPNPDLRYQTATEMLYDLTHLMENDPRMKNHRRRIILTAISALFMFALGSIFCVIGSQTQTDVPDLNIDFDAIRTLIWPVTSAILLLSLIAVTALFIRRMKNIQRQRSPYNIDYPNSNAHDVFFSESNDVGTMLIVSDQILLSLLDLDDPDHKFSYSFNNTDRSYITVGRSLDNHIVLDYSLSVSNRHCEIFCRDDSLYIRDLNSTNGVYIDGKKITEPEKLVDGCIVHLGRSQFKINIR